MQEGNYCNNKKKQTVAVFFIVSCWSEITRPLQFSRDQISLLACTRKWYLRVCVFFFPRQRRRRDSRKVYFSVSATWRELNSLELHAVSISDGEMWNGIAIVSNFSRTWIAREKRKGRVGVGEAEDTKDGFRWCCCIRFRATSHKMALKQIMCLVYIREKHCNRETRMHPCVDREA